jgi:hypothetical protein
MARGIISTILGGVAGGLEGRKNQFLMQQELDERKRREELEQQRWNAMQDQQRLSNALAVRSAGGSVGGAPRLVQEIAAPQAPPRSSALDSALFAGEQARSQPSPIERPDFSQFERPRTEFVVDPDYEEISIGDQTFSFLTQEAEERRAAEAARQNAEAAAMLRQEQRDHEMTMKYLDNDFRKEGDRIRHGYNVALESMRHSNALQRATALAVGEAAQDRLSYADMERAVMNTALRGYKVYDDYGNVIEERPYTAQETRNLVLMLEDAMGFMSGYGQGRGGIPR